MSSNFQGHSKAALIGSKGTIEWDSQFNRANRIVRYDEYGRPQEQYTANYHNEGFEYEIEEVRRCVCGGKKQSYLVPLVESLATIRIIDNLIM